MARRTARPQPTYPTEDLRTLATRCPGCDLPMRSAYTSRRTVVTLAGPRPLRLHVRRCRNRAGPRHHQPYRPEAEGSVALPRHEFGLDVIALAGGPRRREHRSVPEVHRALRARGLSVCGRTVTNLLNRYDQPPAVRLSDSPRLRAITAQRGWVVPAVDGLQPDVGHEVLWVLRDRLSCEVPLARSLLSSTAAAELIGEVKGGRSVPVGGVVFDGQHSIRKAVAQARCRACPTSCATSTAGGKRPNRSTRPTGTRSRSWRSGCEASARSGGRPRGGTARRRRPCWGTAPPSGRRSPDDGRPPLEASGLRLHGRLTAAAAASLGEVAGEKGRPTRPSASSGRSSGGR